MPTDSFRSHGRDIPLELFAGSGHGSHPAVVLVYGTRGMNAPFGAMIRTFATKLSSTGCTALIPNYFAATDTRASADIAGDIAVMDAVPSNRDVWIDTLGDCLAYAAARADANSDRLGLLGFSLGGHLTLRTAKRQGLPRVRAVVSFFAPINQAPFEGIGGDLDKMPPLQIHHGEDDGPPVSPEESCALEAALVAAGKVKDRDYEIFFYAGQGHGFNGQAARTSETRTVDFLSKKLA